MAEVKISALTSATTPLAGTEVVPIVQDGVTKKVAVSNLSAGGSAAWGGITGTLSNQTDLNSALNAKQATLTSGTNIKTINSTSILGSGNLAVQPTLVSGTNIKTINGSSILGSGNIAVASVNSLGIPYSNGSSFQNSPLFIGQGANGDGIVGLVGSWDIISNIGGYLQQYDTTKQGMYIGDSMTLTQFGPAATVGKLIVGSGLMTTGTHTIVSKWLKVMDENNNNYFLPLYT